MSKDLTLTKFNVEKVEDLKGVKIVRETENQGDPKGTPYVIDIVHKNDALPQEPTFTLKITGRPKPNESPLIFGVKKFDLYKYFELAR